MAEKAPADNPPRERFATAMFIAILAAFAIRLLLAFFTIGTNDTMTWLRFAGEISRYGFAESYRVDDQLNHPPLAALSAFAIFRLAVAIGRPMWFPFFLKLPAILGDALSCFLLYQIGRTRGGHRAGMRLATAMAWSLIAIVVSGYHGNTDNLYAAFTLAAVWCMTDRDAPLAAGIFFGAALNVKLIPLPLAFPLLAMCRSKRDVARFIAGSSVGAVPFLIAITVVGKPFIHNVLLYKPVQVRWGFLYAIQATLNGVPSLAATMIKVLDLFRRIGPTLILSLSAAMSFAWWRARRELSSKSSAYGLAAGAYAITLIFAIGFGVQYLVGLVPLLFAFRFRTAIIYSLMAGSFVTAIYDYFWDGGWPWLSDFIADFPHVIAIPGLLVWAMCVWILINLYRVNRALVAGATK